jgi:hypothetical protein
MAADEHPPDEDALARQFLLTLRDGDPEAKAVARRGLAAIFEARDLPAEAVDLLLSNAREGHADAELYRSLARLYRQLGNEALAAEAALESANYAEHVASEARWDENVRPVPDKSPTDQPDAEPRYEPPDSAPIHEGHLPRAADAKSPNPPPDLAATSQVRSGPSLRTLVLRGLGGVVALVLVIAAAGVASRAPLAAASYTVSALAMGLLASGWDAGRRLLRVPSGPLGTGLLGFVFLLTFLMGGALIPRSDGPFVTPSTPPTSTATLRPTATSVQPTITSVAPFAPASPSPNAVAPPSTGLDGVSQASDATSSTPPADTARVAADSISAPAPPAGTAPPEGSPAPLPSPSTALVVTNAGSDGVRLRPNPGSTEAVKILPDGAALDALGEERQEEGRTWRHVRDATGAEGWVATEFLMAGTNAASPATSNAVVAARPQTTPTATALAGLASAGSGRAQPRGGACPATHPIKGNASSMIYHVPGGAFYAKTFPEACFASESDARAAGYRRSRT